MITVITVIMLAMTMRPAKLVTTPPMTTVATITTTMTTSRVLSSSQIARLTPAKLEDFLSAIVNIYGPRMLRYKGVLYMKGTDRKVIFQGVHQLMGSDLGPQWADGEARSSKMVFIGIDLPKDILLQGMEQSLV
jgi:G3E family GTPase